MSKYQMNCSKCGANISMAGSKICNVCTPINGPDDWEGMEASEKAPFLCAKCFAVEHSHSQVIGTEKVTP